MIHNKLKVLIPIILLTISVLIPAKEAQAGYFGPSDADIKHIVQYWLSSSPEISIAEIKLQTAPLKAYYEKNQYTPLWMDDAELSKRAVDALRILMQADSHGLSFATYHGDALSQLQQAKPADDNQEAGRLAAIELLLSDALIQYSHDMQYGVTRPRNRVSADFSETQLSAAEQLEQIAGAKNIRDYLTGLEPNSAGYGALKHALAVHRQTAGNGGWPSFTVGKTIKPGQQDARIPALREILTLTGDLNPGKDIISKEYDKNLQDAIQRFQERHNLEGDGSIGKKTQMALNTPVDKRIEQIIASMERMRWLPQAVGDRHILVNIPGYYLKAYDKGQETLAMRVIVGKPATRTPLFSNSITHVVFNPTWGVPHKIAVKEMLPKIKEDPTYLSRSGFRLVEDGDAVDPEMVDWEQVDADNFNYSLRQQPGNGNALGKVKFSLPNNDDIYLHSTSQPKLFAKAERSLSHGCIRLEKPEDMVKYVMASEGWDDKKATSTYNSSQSRTVNVRPLPVHVVYWTSWVDAEGKTHFADDIYTMDKQLVAALQPQKPTKNIALALK